MTTENKPQRELHRPVNELREQYKNQLHNILFAQLTVDNIENFADDALKKLIQLTGVIVDEYRNNPLIEKSFPMLQRVEEDSAFAAFGLSNIHEVLTLIQAKVDQINSLKRFIDEETFHTNVLITPPQAGKKVERNEKKEVFQKDILPRLLTLLYILENDLEIPLDSILLNDGIVSPEMVRKEPYFRVTVPELGRHVYICEEAGNISYVFDAEKLKESGVETGRLDDMDKGEKNELIKDHPGIGARVMQKSRWRENMKQLITETIPLAHKAEVEGEKDAGQSNSEFAPKKELMTFVDFQAEVRDEYEKAGKPGNITKWFQGEKKKHQGWPYHPNRTYPADLFQGWPELVGVENMTKREWMSFDDFTKDVTSEYIKQGSPMGVEQWYQKERKKHKNWPSNPTKRYLESGWKGYPEMVGLENRLKDWPDFKIFRKEVRDLFIAQGRPKNIESWYLEERKKHKDWPRVPVLIYAEYGLKRWLDLVGAKERLKEWLVFEDFQKEVRRSFVAEGMPINIFRWYLEERKKHKNWPATPNQLYAKTGWKGWQELVGREN